MTNQAVNQKKFPESSVQSRIKVNRKSKGRVVLKRRMEINGNSSLDREISGKMINKSKVNKDAFMLEHHPQALPATLQAC